MKKGIIFLTLAFLFAICSMAGFAFCAGTLCGIYILFCGAVSALLLYFGLSNILRCLSQQKKDYQSFILHQNEQLLNALSAQQTVAKDNTEALHNMCKSTHEELLSVLDDLTEELRNFSQAQHKQLQAFMNQQHHTTKQQTDTITDLLIKSIEQLNSIHNTLDAVANILCRSDDSIDSQNMPTVCDMLQALHTDNLTLFAEQQKNFNQDLFLKEEFFKGCSAFLVAIRELLRNISTIIYQSDSNNTNPEQITSLHSLLTNIQKSIPESTGQLKKLISDNGFQLDEITNALDDSSDSLNAYLSDLKTYLAKYSDLSQQDAALLKNLLEEPYD